MVNKVLVVEDELLLAQNLQDYLSAQGLDVRIAHDRSDLQVFLQDGEKIYVVRNGDVIDDTWKIAAISDAELSLVYLPLHLSQTLSVGSTQ